MNRLSSCKNIFNHHKAFYNEALHNSGYKNELKYLEANRHHKNRDNNIGNHGTNNDIMDDEISKTINKNRRRNIIWFNPPFCKLSKINRGKYFLGLINKNS